MKPPNDPSACELAAKEYAQTHYIHSYDPQFDAYKAGWSECESHMQARIDTLDEIDGVKEDIISHLKSKLEVALKYLTSISKNGCCDNCQEAKLVALEALAQLTKESK